MTEVLGVDAELREIRAAGLPLHLASEYALYRIDLLGTSSVLAVARGEEPSGTPTQVQSALDALARATGQASPVLVVRRLSWYQRQRLIEAGVPFIVPGTQMFLPHLGTDLREHFPRARRSRAEFVTWAAQVVLLRHLLHRDVEGLSLADTAARLGYSPMTLSNVRRELVAAELVGEAVTGRRKDLGFLLPPKETWERAEPLMRSPVGKSVHVGQVRRAPVGRLAGESALATYTNLGAGPLPVLAMARDRFREDIEEARYTVCQFEDRAEYRVEVWRYDPFVLANGERVDALSLFLSVRGSADERIRIAAAELLGGLRW